MSQQLITLGPASSPQTGDSVRVAITKAISNFGELYAHTTDYTNPHEVTAAQVGAIPVGQMGAAGGIATLGSDGILTATQRPPALLSANTTPGSYAVVTVASTGLVTSGRSLTAADVDTALGYVPVSPILPLSIVAGSLGTLTGSIVYSAAINTNVGSNGSVFAIETVRNITGNDWTTASTRLQQRIDVTGQGYIEFNPTGRMGSISINPVDEAGIPGNGSYQTVLINYNGVIVATSMTPATTAAYDLGSPTLMWRNIYASGTITGSVSGSAGTAAKLTTARSISASGDATGTTTFDGSANVTLPLTLGASGVTAGTYAKVVVNAKGLVTASSTLSAADVAPAFSSSLGASGWTTLPNGLIMQWGQVPFSGVTNNTVSGSGSTYQAASTAVYAPFPLPFPSACYNVTANGANDGTYTEGSEMSVGISAQSTSGVTFQIVRATGTNISGNETGVVNYMAIGR